jgi:hypothetical protein
LPFLFALYSGPHRRVDSFFGYVSAALPATSSLRQRSASALAS